MAQAKSPEVKVTPGSYGIAGWVGVGGRRGGMGGVQFTVWGLRLPSRPPPAPPEPPAPLPFVCIKLSSLCKSVPASASLKGRLFPGLQNRSLATCWQPKPILDKLGGGHFAAGRCFCAQVETGDAEPRCGQMGGSGDGTCEAGSRINTDGVRQMQCQRQTVLMKCSVDLPRHGSVLGCFRMPPTPLCCSSPTS